MSIIDGGQMEPEHGQRQLAIGCRQSWGLATGRPSFVSTPEAGGKVFGRTQGSGLGLARRLGASLKAKVLQGC